MVFSLLGHCHSSLLCNAMEEEVLDGQMHMLHFTVAVMLPALWVYIYIFI